MLLPRSVSLRVQYALMHFNDLSVSDAPNARKWLRCINAALSALPPEKQRLFQLHYIQHRSADDAMEELHIEHTTFYAWRNTLLTHIATHAAAAGLLPIRE